MGILNFSNSGTPRWPPRDGEIPLSSTGPHFRLDLKLNGVLNVSMRGRTALKLGERA